MPPLLCDVCNHLRKVIIKVRRDTDTVVEVMIVGDFNRHDQHWEGDDVSLERARPSKAKRTRYLTI
jgi:hypothetical protein